MKEYWLTTKDNPYNPFEQFPEWYRFDLEKGYHSSERLARIALVPESLSKQEQQEEILDSIQRIIKIDSNFMMVEREIPG
jgi:epoxyqueuosine reductase QueG